MIKISNLDLFLKKHQGEAKRELDCYNILMKKAVKHMMHGEFSKVAVCHENIARSLHELQKLRNEKITHDQIVKLINKTGLRALKEVVKELKTQKTRK